MFTGREGADPFFFEEVLNCSVPAAFASEGTRVLDTFGNERCSSSRGLTSRSLRPDDGLL
jgi:hypothetical protein